MNGCREICSVYGFHVFDCPTRDQDPTPEPTTAALDQGD